MNERRDRKIIIVALLLGLAVVLYFAKLRRDALMNWHAQPAGPRTAVSQTVATQVSIRKDEVKDIDDSSLLSQATFVPHFDKGFQDGLIVLQIRENSLLSKIHVLEGDVITSIEDVPLQNNDQLASILKRLKFNGNVTFTLKRGGQNQSIKLTVRR